MSSNNSEERMLAQQIALLADCNAKKATKDRQAIKEQEKILEQIAKKKREEQEKKDHLLALQLAKEPSASNGNSSSRNASPFLRQVGNVIQSRATQKAPSREDLDRVLEESKKTYQLEQEENRLLNVAKKDSLRFNSGFNEIKQTEEKSHTLSSDEELARDLQERLNINRSESVRSTLANAVEERLSNQYRGGRGSSRPADTSGSSRNERASDQLVEDSWSLFD